MCQCSTNCCTSVVEEVARKRSAGTEAIVYLELLVLKICGLFKAMLLQVRWLRGMNSKMMVMVVTKIFSSKLR